MAKHAKGYLYHYTDEEGLDGITSEGVIRKSTDTKTDAMMGKGVYLTDLRPNNSADRILNNNYDGARSGKEEKITHYIRIKKGDLPDVTKNRIGDRSVYKNPDDIDLDRVNYKTGSR